jgi:HKD family nuclease
VRPIFQSHLRPTEIMLGLTSLASSSTTRLRVAVAYTTFRGARALVEMVSNRIGRDWNAIPKDLITSFEFGHTDPAALAYLTAIPNFSVHVASVGASDIIPILPAVTNFHPKIYIFDRGAIRDVLISSANLSERALTVNTEIGILDPDTKDGAILDDFWTALLGESVPLTGAILADYKKRRPVPKKRVVDPDRRVIPMAAPAPGTLSSFGDAVISGTVDPARFDSFWVEAGSMSSGGSYNQLELPRGANRFFGFAFSSYTGSRAVRIGQPPLLADTKIWRDRWLTWHGHNAMERINLPTAHQGGFDYPGTAVLFRRTPGGFQFTVAAWNSTAAVAWRNASARANAIYRLGAHANRVVGLF